MNKVALCAAALGMLWLGFPYKAVQANEQAVLRIATLAPEGTGAGKVFHAFDTSVRKRTGDKLKMRLYAGGVAGDERDVIRKMKAGQMEGAALTSIGLGQIVRSVLVLQLPGLFENREQVAKVRKELAADFQKQFEDAGYVLLAWGDVGDRRIFSTKPINVPADFKTVRPWVWREDPISAELMSLIGANAVPLGLPEVLAALQTGMVDTVTATAISAVGLQWFRFIKHMSKSTGEPVIGAMVVRKPWFDAQPADVQEAMRESSGQVQQLLMSQIHIDDDKAAATLRQKGVKEFDMMAHRDDWEPVLIDLADKLTGRLYNRDLLERVYKTAHDGKPMPTKKKK